MKNRLFILMLIFIIVPFYGISQLEILQGYWVHKDYSLTILLELKFSKKTKTKDKINATTIQGLMKSSNTLEYKKAAYYFTVRNNEFLIFDAYGNVICNSLTYKINQNEWSIGENCNFHFKRISKDGYEYINYLIKLKNASKYNNDKINTIDYN